MSQVLSAELNLVLKQEAEHIGLDVNDFVKTLLNYYSFFQEGKNGLFSPSLDRAFQNQLQEAFHSHEALFKNMSNLGLK